MGKDFGEAIAALEAERQKQLAQVEGTESAINSLLALSGRPEKYKPRGPSSQAHTEIQSDTFYGRPLATCVREYLGMRKAAGNGAASVADIHQALVAGGYEFNTKNDENAKRSLRISLTKNTIFHKLPNGQYGMLAWYPNAKSSKAAADDEAEADGGGDGSTPEVTEEE